MSKSDFNLQNNPLIHPPVRIAHNLLPYHLARPDHFIPAVELTIEQAKERLQAIRDLDPADATFENTIEALEFCDQDLGAINSTLGVFLGSYSNDEYQKVEEVVDEITSAYGSPIFMDEALFARIDAVYQKRASLNLTLEQNKILEETHRGFRENGVDLPQDKKERLIEISLELSKATSLFRNNILADTNKFQKIITDENDLAGLPDKVKQKYAAIAKTKGHEGKWLIPLSPPPIDIAEYADNRALRQEIQTARANIAADGEFGNKEVIKTILKLRHERASILGFKNYAEYVLSSGKMAKSPQQVIDMLENDLDVYGNAAKEDAKAYKDFAEKRDGITQLEAWDILYYKRLYAEEVLGINEQEIREYFELESVLKGLFEHAEKLFNISLKESNDKYPRFGADENVYEVVDNKTNKVIALFTTDFYARAGQKSAGAWMNNFRGSGYYNGQKEIPVIRNTCNYEQATEGKPTLLPIGDVTTLFHEFGHALHGILSETDYPSLSGTSVPRDFVELPSQLMENWVWQPEVLRKLARHHETGVVISEDLIEKIQTLKNFDIAYTEYVQASYGMLDMKYYTTDPAKIDDIVEFEEDLMNTSAIYGAAKNGVRSTSFSHIMSGGYAVGYYAYKWSRLLDSDAFEAFLENGLYDQDTAASLRENILSKGGTVDPAELYRRFRGRDADPNALYRRQGILPKDSSEGTTPNAAQKPPKPPAP